MKLLVDIARVSGFIVLMIDILKQLRPLAGRSDDLSSGAGRGGRLTSFLFASALAAWLLKGHQPVQPLLMLGGLLLALSYVGTNGPTAPEPRDRMRAVNLALGLTLVGVVALASVGPFLIKSPGPHIRHSAWVFGSLIALSYVGIRIVLRRSTDRHTLTNA